MTLLLLFLCFILGCCSSSLIKYVSNLMASSSSPSPSSSSSAPPPPPPPPSPSSSSSSSSSHYPQMKHDVFISFRGSDIRHGFLNHLKNALQKETDVFVDDKLERGDELSSALRQAIEASEISLIIFSKDYAASKWCLEELVKIMECKELNKQIVIPVFYNIDPSDVRHQKGTYEDAFAQHEQKLKDNMEKVQNWRSALNKAANLCGHHYLSNFANESKLIDEIRKDVLEKLSFISPVETKSLVGIDQSISYIESLLVSKPKGVQVIGIWGIGGIGKTTLARAVFDKLSPQYQSCCFLENVREETEKNGWSYLLNKLLSELLGEENSYKHCTARAKSSLIKRKLSRTKFFIVLDDVTTGEQLEYLAKELNCLESGSRVIITSRDKHVLNVYKVNAIYEVKELNFQESLKLFSLNAFNQSHPKMGYEKLSERAVVYTKGIPLALKILGSYFHSENIETWESALQKLCKYPNERIQNVLKVSYDGLDDLEKEIFLDIAFFFRGECKDDVIRVLNACDFYGACGINSLLHKALITITNNNTIEMHDLIQEMREQIVREECIKHPEQRSRLNDIEEVYDVLKNNKGIDAVEGISFITDVELIRDVELSAETFKKMPNLRILKFKSRNVKLPSGLESFPDKLRYLHWDAYPLKSLPLNFCVEKLVELHMEGSNLTKLSEGMQDLVNLKSINLRRSSCLLELPDFSKAENLQIVDLSYCKKNRVPEWFGYQQTDTTITTELASPLDDLKGFTLWFVQFPYFSKAAIAAYDLHCRCYFGDGEEVEALKVWTYPFFHWRLESDHVFIWYEPFEYEEILEEVKRRRGNDEGITYNLKLSFKFSVESGRRSSGKLVKHDELIKACGVCPIYASENHNFLQQMELKMKTKRRRNTDEQQQLPPAKRFIATEISTEKERKALYRNPFSMKTKAAGY